MNQLVFYWSGENVEIPKILVKSVLISNEGLKIIQVTDKKTDKIEGVNEVLRIDKSDNIIMDRIKGWSLIDTKNNQTLFIDADTILLKKLISINSKKEIISIKEPLVRCLIINTKQHILN